MTVKARNIPSNSIILQNLTYFFRTLNFVGHLPVSYFSGFLLSHLYLFEYNTLNTYDCSSTKCACRDKSYFWDLCMLAALLCNIKYTFQTPDNNFNSEVQRGTKIKINWI